ncbi:MAG: ABC transporter ATP-binding protein [Pseudomonadales bacterium]|nr:ABC transporter ATP-binding protein [Pseudomonadales bacterium]
MIVAAAERKIILSARAISKSYVMGEVTVHALRKVSLDLHEGELLVLLGASGSGKSTLLNILGGLDTVSSGTLFYHQQELTAASQRELTHYRRQHVGFVFQFYNLIASLSARENVALVTDISEHPMRAEEALELVGLSSRLDHFPAQLSGGEQQRVAIARAIAKRPQILLCDEPTGALDAQTGKLVLSVLDTVNRETGTTTAIITHNAAIGSLGDSVVYMSSGEIIKRHDNAQRAAVDSVQW